MGLFDERMAGFCVHRVTGFFLTWIETNHGNQLVLPASCGFENTNDSRWLVRTELARGRDGIVCWSLDVSDSLRDFFDVCLPCRNWGEDEGKQSSLVGRVRSCVKKLTATATATASVHGSVYLKQSARRGIHNNKNKNKNPKAVRTVYSLLQCLS